MVIFGLGLIVAFLAWRKGGATSAWFTILALVDFGIEGALWLAVLFAVWGLFRRELCRSELRRIAVLAPVTVVLHALEPALIEVTKAAGIVAGIPFLVFKLFRKW